MESVLKKKKKAPKPTEKTEPPPYSEPRKSKKVQFGEDVAEVEHSQARKTKFVFPSDLSDSDIPPDIKKVQIPVPKRMTSQ